MRPIRFFTDEDIYARIAVALRDAGFDTTSTMEAGRGGSTDLSQLEWASGENRTIITFNVAHFAKLHRDWIQQGRHHAGIVVSRQRSIGELLQGLLNLASSLSADEMSDRLEFLSNW